MKIKSIAALPDVATRKEWQELINRDMTTFRRAEALGLLRPRRISSRCVAYTKKDILKWLQIEATD
jgi:hypothetical protein